ncbi:uncharacterized protein LOC126671669 isoform X2 [Mercurialis annua]|uniref:uncharacterized protein LOC126671669 isoform X2 n=1 Tax=Mercurialis annua TaxID=3986 RepID=UPI0024ACF044|nr:uncharacterized protein LOC126671669 isoform X2 [Mercurialis annua]
MAYIPPHKRLSLDKDRPPPVAESIRPLFKENLSLNTRNKSGKIVYANSCISRWFAVGLSDNGEFPSHVRLQPVSAESFEHQSGGNSLILVNTYVNEENNELSKNYMSSPWVTIASKVEHDLFSSVEILRKEMSYHGLEKVKPTLVARFGKIRFHGPSVSLENLQQNQVNETLLRQSKRSFYSNIPSSYMKNTVDEVVQKIGIDFEEEKDIYHVKLSDNTRTDSTISCKCSVRADKRLMFYKVELNQVRQMIADISCLDKNLDLRLMLCSKRILTTLTEDEINSIKELVSSAVLDSDVKGGLRWPVGKTSSGDRFSVVGVWHTVTRAYSSPSLRLKVRHADRYDFRMGFGESGKEVHMKLKGIVSEFLEQGARNDSVSDMLKDNLKLICDNFLCCERFST